MLCYLDQMKGHIIIFLLRFICIPHIFVEYNLLNCLKTFLNKKKSLIVFMLHLSRETSRQTKELK